MPFGLSWNIIKLQVYLWSPQLTKSYQNPKCCLYSRSMYKIVGTTVLEISKAL